MQRVFSYRQGDRAEYLAQYILSAFAISVPVPRQEDVGNDFHCSLLRREGPSLYPYLPFNIQIKSHNDDLVKKGISFGGVTASAKNPKWRKHEIEQLREMQTPFLIGAVNKDEQWMDIFGTVPRYFVSLNWHQLPQWPREVIFVPYSPTGEGHLGAGEITKLDPLPDMPDVLLTIPLGRPIVRISISDSEDQGKCEEIKALLEPYLLLDQQNAVLNRLGVHYLEWPLIMRTGQKPNEMGAGAVLGPPGSPPFEAPLPVLCKIVASTLKTYVNLGRKDLLAPWMPILDQLPFDKSNTFIQDMIVEARKAFAKE